MGLRSAVRCGTTAPRQVGPATGPPSAKTRPQTDTGVDPTRLLRQRSKTPPASTSAQRVLRLPTRRRRAQTPSAPRHDGRRRQRSGVGHTSAACPRTRRKVRARSRARRPDVTGHPKHQPAGPQSASAGGIVAHETPAASATSCGDSATPARRTEPTAPRPPSCAPGRRGDSSTDNEFNAQQVPWKTPCGKVRQRLLATDGGVIRFKIPHFAGM